MFLKHILHRFVFYVLIKSMQSVSKVVAYAYVYNLYVKKGCG